MSSQDWTVIGANLEGSEDRLAPSGHRREFEEHGRTTTVAAVCMRLSFLRALFDSLIVHWTISLSLRSTDCRRSYKRSQA